MTKASPLLIKSFEWLALKLSAGTTEIGGTTKEKINTIKLFAVYHCI